MNAIINNSNEGHETKASDYIVYERFYSNFQLSIKCDQKASLSPFTTSPRSHPSIPRNILPSLPPICSWHTYSLGHLLSFALCYPGHSIPTWPPGYTYTCFRPPLLPLSTKIRKWMKTLTLTLTLTTEDFSGLQYWMMLTKFLLRLKNQFLNLTALIKFSYVVTECKNPVIISQLLLKRQQYKYVLEKHSYKTEPLLCSSLKI